MQPHSFEVSAEWQGNSNGAGVLNSPSGLHCQFAVPTEFGGPGGCPSPEEMFLASIASCFVITLAYMAQTKKLPLQHQSIHIKGTVEREAQTRKLRFTQIEIQLNLKVDPNITDAQRESLQRSAYDAKGFCLVSNSIREDIEFHIHSQITS